MKRSRATSKPGWAGSKPHRRGDKSPCADPKTSVHRARPIVQRDAIPRPPDQAFHAPPKTFCAVRKSVCAPRKTVCAAPAFTLCSVKTRPCITQILLGTTQVPLGSSDNPPRSRFSPVRGRIWEQKLRRKFPSLSPHRATISSPRKIFLANRRRIESNRRTQPPDGDRSLEGSITRGG
jgi:hypothetical protein